MSVVAWCEKQTTIIIWYPFRFWHQCNREPPGTWKVGYEARPKFDQIDQHPFARELEVHEVRLLTPRQSVRTLGWVLTFRLQKEDINDTSKKDSGGTSTLASVKSMKSTSPVCLEMKGCTSTVTTFAASIWTMVLPGRVPPLLVAMEYSKSH
jgi:hypothetical protein